MSHSYSLIYTLNIPLYTTLRFHPSVVLLGIAQPNEKIKEKQRFTSNLPLIQPHPPLNHSLPYQADCSKGSIPMTAPTQTLPPLPPLKAREYNYQTTSNRIQDALDKKPHMEWYPNSFQRAATNKTQQLREILVWL